MLARTDQLNADDLKRCQACSSSSIYQIPNTEHIAYRLVRTLVYKRGVGARPVAVAVGMQAWP
eukprot:scaffold117396_cov51-Phaeocystis_antarctica.AAC.1